MYDLLIGGLVVDVWESWLQSPTNEAVERYQRPRSIDGGHEGEEKLEQSTCFDEELWFPVSIWTEQKRTWSLINNYHFFYFDLLLDFLFFFLLLECCNCVNRKLLLNDSFKEFLRLTEKVALSIHNPLHIYIIVMFKMILG